jgi:hypothetical protein
MSIQTDLEAQLTAITTAITAALATPSANWKVGDVSFNQGDYLKMLIDQRDKIIEQLRSIPSESIDTVQNSIGTLGHDSTEYVGEDL